MFLYFRCWSSYKSSIPAPQGHLGRICGGQRPKEECEGWEETEGGGKLRDGERGAQIHWFAIQRWAKFLFKSGSFHATWFQLTFLPQLVPEVPAPSSYWSQDDPRSVAAHRGIIAQIVLDFQPLSIVNNKGFIINNRQVYRALTSSQMIWFYSGWPCPNSNFTAQAGIEPKFRRFLKSCDMIHQSFILTIFRLLIWLALL